MSLLGLLFLGAMANERFWGGSRYELHGGYKTRIQADRAAKRLRQDGWRARVVKATKGYAVYKR